MVLLAAILGLFSWLTWSLRANPEESLHFVQYGVMSLLLFRSLSHHVRDPSIYLLAGLIGSFFGIVDEVIQWIVPRRFFDFRDIGINVLAVALVQLALAGGLRPASIRGRMGRAGLRLACAAAAVNAAVMLFCVNNTPFFIDLVRLHVRNVAWIEEAMCEYGYLHHDPEIGTFKSRLTLDELARDDREQHPRVIEYIHGAMVEKQYYRFLASIPAHTNQLMVEARVHLFRRDRYSDYFRDPEKAADKKDNATVAYYENRIMEKYFPHTLTNSMYRWLPNTRAMFERNADRSGGYESPVSRELITAVSRRTLNILLGGLLAASLAGIRILRPGRNP